ncbi:coenzyme Q-binding protein COQ10 homolog, mitochondrial-like [Cucurbita maxima]|uniref:Coenzyme Q-binding protein COQ10 homolog, mitochondrial-like n=1 Tax=Cucurbita maxima TaxID=3661 RepID=A0A6J1J282_CUCMA|nr:coenzyme Q-binding protein COQ10 homolog, mitochondrial-like [Cucurbita maxima]
MLPFLSTSKVGKSLISRRRDVRHAIKYASCNAEPWKYQNVRHVKCIAGVETSSIHRLFDKGQKIFHGSFHDTSAGQTRRFIGCGDGQEGGVLSKIYEERRVMGYSPEQLFDVVAAVDLYHDFVPWCQRSEVIKTYPDGSFDAELEIGFKFLVESYTSHVEIQRPKSVKTTVSQSTLFDHLINIWEFQPGPVPGTCNLYFLVDFKFQSPLYRQVASVFFKEVVSKLVGSFSDRCRLIYGPGVAVLENSYGQRA